MMSKTLTADEISFKCLVFVRNRSIAGNLEIEHFLDRDYEFNFLNLKHVKLLKFLFLF